MAQGGALSWPLSHLHLATSSGHAPLISASPRDLECQEQTQQPGFPQSVLTPSSTSSVPGLGSLALTHLRLFEKGASSSPSSQAQIALSMEA